MPAQKPDTSPANVARVLKRVLDGNPIVHNGLVTKLGAEIYDLHRALADALEQQTAPISDTPFRGALTKGEWERRVRLATLPHPYNSGGIVLHPDTIRSVLRAAFPELAPSDD